MLNELDNEKDRTQNFKDHRTEMQDFSITAIVKAYDYINTLSQFIPQNNEVLDDLEIIIEPLTNIIKKLMTDDGNCFDTEKEARKYLEVKYGNQLTMVVNKILLIEKYVPLCEFIEENLNLFKELIEFKNELDEKMEVEDDDNE